MTVVDYLLHAKNNVRTYMGRSHFIPPTCPELFLNHDRVLGTVFLLSPAVFYLPVKPVKISFLIIFLFLALLNLIQYTRVLVFTMMQGDFGLRLKSSFLHSFCLFTILPIKTCCVPLFDFHFIPHWNPHILITSLHLCVMSWSAWK